MDLTLSQKCLIVNTVLFMPNPGFTEVEAERLLKECNPKERIWWPTAPNKQENFGDEDFVTTKELVNRCTDYPRAD
jgi:hypothetical protein